MNKPWQQLSPKRRQTRLISELDSLLLLANLATLVKAGWRTWVQNQPFSTLFPDQVIQEGRQSWQEWKLSWRPWSCGVPTRDRSCARCIVWGTWLQYTVLPWNPLIWPELRRTEPVSSRHLHLHCSSTSLSITWLHPYSGNSLAAIALWSCQTLSLDVDTKRKTLAAHNRISICP